MFIKTAFVVVATYISSTMNYLCIFFAHFSKIQLVFLPCKSFYEIKTLSVCSMLQNIFPFI